MSKIIRQLKQIVDSDVPVILEIGACKGEDSLHFLNIFDNIRLFCFEPDPKNCNDHRELISDHRCRLIETAITDKDGDVTFHCSGGKYPERRHSGSLRNPKDHLKMHPWCIFDEKLIVSGITLDTWCRQNEINHIDLIWADVNGAETSMIAGAQQSLQYTKYLYTEFGPNGYEIYEGGVTKNQIKILLPDFEEVLVHTNNVLLKNTKGNNV